ncbi:MULTISPECIES: thioredoxin [unclassified Fibrobacter]|uniref:thioredoxin n=1 Tax=unclassified Fibrobacter TaxID=2634177 RepID=UPI000D6B92CE|nr:MULTISPECIES: thioredoxin [unclassified Fibrobacter]PWJ71820.1 thioredoxin [Fibrobacter sp. UWR4]PZW73735.1 thioredoxin [Fibrobacter sp. UWR1]
MAALNLTADKFDEVISSGQLVFVDFWATWCRPCMMMGPVVEELASEYEGKAIIAKMNVDEPGVGDICARFGITNIPNMKLFKNGVEVGNVVGAVPKNTVKTVIDRNL